MASWIFGTLLNMALLVIFFETSHARVINRGPAKVKNAVNADFEDVDSFFKKYWTVLSYELLAEIIKTDNRIILLKVRKFFSFYKFLHI